jgi:hypothetical protein
MDAFFELHPWLKARQSHWQRLELLREAGFRLKENAFLFLPQGTVETKNRYNVRLKRFVPCPFLADGIGHYVSTIEGQAIAIDGATDQSAIEALTQFREDADRQGNTLNAVLATLADDLLTFGCCFVAHELPRPSGALTWMEQRNNGDLEAYLTRYSPRDVVNWEEDDDGLVWISFQFEVILGGKGTKRTIVYSRLDYSVFEQREEQWQLVENGQHAHADLAKVPVWRAITKPQYWLGDKAAASCEQWQRICSQMEEALEAVNLAIPVVTGMTFDDSQLVADGATLVNLPEPNAKFGWSAPDGNGIAFAQQELLSLREEIYRTLHLQSMGTEASATAAKASGESKRADRQPSLKILNGLCSVLRPIAQQAAQRLLVLQNFGDVPISVRGLSFADDASQEMLGLSQIAQTLDVPSPTFRRELAKRTVSAFVPNLPEQTAKAIIDELDAAPFAPPLSSPLQ